MTGQTKSPTKHKPNRLIEEKSPYLLQHAYNPVDWYPWGDEAFIKAKSRNMPIFLSIGYSTCHWCHVMERESFENPEIAKLMNKYFVNIKVDREERPDVDAIYMDSVMMLQGSGGWPLSVWLTPDLKPFHGGTYFPPEDRYGRPGFITVINKIGDLWQNKRDKLIESSDKITDALKQTAISFTPKGEITNPTEIFDNAFKQLEGIFDAKEGGFGPPPKFPMPVYMEFLINYYGRTQNNKALVMADLTMTKILKGGITDQLGGGFARYSTDGFWVTPHFEKMLYDNAQLTSVLADLYHATGNEFFADNIRKTIEYLNRDMKHKQGAFFSAEDADSEGEEGKFYVWRLEEIKKILGDELSKPFITRYGVTPNGNFDDPHSQELGRNILVQAHTIKETANKIGKSEEETEKLLKAAEKRLFDVRARRVRPHLDDKILTGWNGLMITALSKSGFVLNEPRYIDMAETAADFILTNLYDNKKKKLYRRWREGERKIEAHQIDYALFIEGLIHLFQVSGRVKWLEWAQILHEQHNKLFWDAKGGGYYMTVERKDLLVRVKDDRDNVIPSGNSVAALNGFRLGDMTGRAEWANQARETLKTFSGVLDRHPVALSKMLNALDFDSKGHFQTVIVGHFEDQSSQSLLEVARRTYVPQNILFRVDPKTNQTDLAKINPFLEAMAMQDSKPTGYFCLNYACKKPTSDPAEFKKQINSAIPEK